MRAHHLSLIIVLGAAGCPSAATHDAPLDKFPPQTTLASGSARCKSGGTCECRPLEGEGQAEEGIPAGHKRFELRLPKTTSAIWVSVTGTSGEGSRGAAKGGVFYKPPEVVAPACFYFDLTPGQHTITVHSERKDVEVGLQTGLKIYEHGTKGWYRSLDFVCGANEKCTKPAMDAWVAFQKSQPRGVLDACGSTMIRHVTFRGVREEKALPEYTELDVHMLVKVYAFETFRAPGSPDCRAPVKNVGGED
jgi:hypothetical protein